MSKTEKNMLHMLYIKYNLTHQVQIHEGHDAYVLTREIHHLILSLVNLLHVHNQHLID